MWPVPVQRQFDIAQAAGNDALENVLHAPYNKLLNTLFPVDTAFTVIPNFQKTISSTNLGVDYLVTFEIFLENRPVFVLGLKREKDFSTRSKRTAADNQLRARLGDLIGNALLPPSLSIFICSRYLSSTCLARCQRFRDQTLLLLHYEGRIDQARVHSRLRAVRDRHRTGWPLELRYPDG